MFPVTIEGITYPSHFKTQAEAEAAADEFLQEQDVYDTSKVFRAKTDNGGVYFVLQDNKGDVLPLPEIRLPVRLSKVA
ncbi:hypothetical protein [Pseudomonas fluorescens]|uniref:hypothetical protein n=1 Tax=Pseudomonas fluorescens TaxID=294 RepID=UPI0011AE2D14|nr:hypothetical protein [Pseudomonas fluorescens]MCI4606887.1 hypothetical protein [Pseudomonas fluorescens]